MLPENIRILEKIDRLIQCKQTGTPDELAQRFHVSEKCIRIYIGHLKELGAPVCYCRKRRTYYYKEVGYFCFTFTQFVEKPA